MKEELLTIGTVVMLKNANHALMIIGFFPQAMEGENKQIYDYLACHFPEGLEDTTKQLMFNKEDIEKIISKSFSDEDDIKFKEVLLQNKEKILSKMKGE